jgi:hypothetical protein
MTRRMFVTWFCECFIQYLLLRTRRMFVAWLINRTRSHTLFWS